VLVSEQKQAKGCELAEYQAGMRWDVGCGIDAWTGKGKKVRRPEQLILPAQSCPVKEDEVVLAKDVLCL
jgi:hypothetical protein